MPRHRWGASSRCMYFIYICLYSELKWANEEAIKYREKKNTWNIFDWHRRNVYIVNVFPTFVCLVSHGESLVHGTASKIQTNYAKWEQPSIWSVSIIRPNRDFTKRKKIYKIYRICIRIRIFAHSQALSISILIEVDELKQYDASSLLGLCKL